MQNKVIADSGILVIPPMTPPAIVHDGPGDPNCPRCRGIGYLRHDVPIGHPEFGKLHTCECRASEIALHNQAKMSQLSNLSEKELLITIDSLIPRGDCTQEMIAQVKRMAAEPFGMLTLWGSWGNGKTAALMGLVNHFNAVSPGSTCYMRFEELMNVVRKGFKDGAELDAEERAMRLRQIYFLAIDEFDKANLTQWGDSFRSLFFDDRYRDAKNGMTHTALAMNCNLTDLPGHIYDRIQWGTKVAHGFRVVRNTDTSARESGL